MFTVMTMTVALMFPQAQGQQQGQPERTPGQQAADKLDLDGNWTVLCFEKDGQPVEEAKNATVTIKDNLIRFTAKDGTSKMKAMRIEFDKPGHIRVTETEPTSTGGAQQGNTGDRGAGKAEAGVYVAAKDYLAICLHDESAERGAGNGQANSTTGQATGSQTAASGPSAKSKCTVILKREGLNR